MEPRFNPTSDIARTLEKIEEHLRRLVVVAEAESDPLKAELQSVDDSPRIREIVREEFAKMLPLQTELHIDGRDVRAVWEEVTRPPAVNVTVKQPVATHLAEITITASDIRRSIDAMDIIAVRDAVASVLTIRGVIYHADYLGAR